MELTLKMKMFKIPNKNQSSPSALAIKREIGLVIKSDESIPDGFSNKSYVK